jgi:hypothetical protein
MLESEGECMKYTRHAKLRLVERNGDLAKRQKGSLTISWAAIFWLCLSQSSTYSSLKQEYHARQVGPVKCSTLKEGASLYQPFSNQVGRWWAAFLLTSFSLEKANIRSLLFLPT